jgi:hypothetical protein
MEPNNGGALKARDNNPRICRTCDRSYASAQRHVGSNQSLKRTFGAWRFRDAPPRAAQSLRPRYQETRLRCWSLTRKRHPFFNGLLGGSLGTGMNNGLVSKARDNNAFIYCS